MKNLFDLTGKVALVTGGSRGLGRAMALGFAEAGADVAIASRNLESCQKAAAEVEALGRQAFAYACHVGRWDELEGLVDAVYERFGKLDILVNNAGMSPLSPSVVETSEELFDKVIGVNFKGPFRLGALVGSRMAAGEGGSIINVSSTAAINPRPETAPYSAAKAALNAITRAFAFEYGPKVRVNCIMSGPFHTDASASWSRTEAFAESAKRGFALQRAGDTHEMVSSALYFASDATSFTTGAILRVDGGGT